MQFIVPWKCLELKVWGTIGITVAYCTRICSPNPSWIRICESRSLIRSWPSRPWGIKTIFFLSRYLQEIGYTDTIIDVRSNRVRSLLGLHEAGDEENRTNNAVNGESGVVRRSGNADTNNSGKRIGVTTTLAEEMMIDTEAAVMANFEFLASEVSCFLWRIITLSLAESCSSVLVRVIWLAVIHYDQALQAVLIYNPWLSPMNS